MEINLNRLKKNLNKLGEIGLGPGGGITRLAFTESYEQANQFVRSLFEKAGLIVEEDPVGNLIGKKTGITKDQSIIVGSHIDTVPQGGMFDGSLGVLSGLECIETLIEHNYENQYNLEVIAFIGEEGTNQLGGTFGSSCFTGEITIDDQLVAMLPKLGLTLEDITDSCRDSTTIKNYLELHPEQGPLLDEYKIAIGIVKGIVGITRYRATVTGISNHAGTTRMEVRDDALLKASKIIIKINQIVKELGPPLVGTVGDIKCKPGAINVIPGKVEFPIELRSMSQQQIKRALELLKEESSDLDLSLTKIEQKPEVKMSSQVQQIIESCCQNLNYKYRYINSAAGHDASPLAKVTDAGMIFVPSKDGISHAPQEWTDWSDVAQGANLLLQAIVKLDQNNY